MGKKKYYLTLDTETATLPFSNQLCKSEKQKQTIAIAKPLVYDIGWVITDRAGNVIKKENYLVQETFFVPNVFNTAYYKDKRPIYMKMLQEGKIKVDLWDNIIKILIEDLKVCDLTTAYNACFDFKKAIPFTERYIYHLYREDYTEWEEKQKNHCKHVLLSGDNDTKNPEYLKPYFKLRGVEYPIADLWGVSCERLINIDKYRDYCLENNLLTSSAQYFKSSAETSFQYLMKNYKFIEDHTALSDAEIESQILTKALKKGKVEPSIVAFPFRILGTTFDYVKNNRKKKYAKKVYEALKEYLEMNADKPNNSYWSKMEKELYRLETIV
jgi:hypothetical protein